MLPSDLTREFEKLSETIAGALNLKGLMDVEVILNNGELKVLEIDARLPSQTPTAIFWSTGLNIVEMLGELFMFPDRPIPEKKDHRGVVYEHIKVSPNRIEVAGEHIMSGADPLYVQTDFFGADEAITNFTTGRNNWVATLIISALDRNQAWEKRNTVIKTIRKKFGLDYMCDSTLDGHES
jgi:pyrrolysine biosynthesis protein PylC